MILKKLIHKKGKAQAMVEFAIALPVLLLLLYGIIETGRYLFLYSTVVTASRQAVRYGAATGVGTDFTSLGGPNNTIVSRYEDCYGIRQAAKNAAYLGPFTDNNITIKYDSGPSTGQTPYCSAGSPVDDTFDPKTDNTSRIEVTVTKQFIPLVKLVPFSARPITAKSARTILVSVSIQVTSPPITFIASTPTNTPSPTPTPTNTATATNTPTATLTPALSFTPSNTPTITLTPLPSVTLPPSATPTIAPTFTPSPTSVPSCIGITHGPITKTGNTLSMTITNPWGFPLTTGTGTVTWNDDRGHQTGSDKSLSLQTIAIGSTIVWTGNSIDVSTIPFTNSAIIPPNSTVTITFTFHQSYDNFDGTEDIYINLITPGCEGNPIQS